MHPSINQSVAHERLADAERRRPDRGHEPRHVRHPVRAVRVRVGHAVVAFGRRLADEAVPVPRGVPPDPLPPAVPRA